MRESQFLESGRGFSSAVWFGAFALMATGVIAGGVVGWLNGGVVGAATWGGIGLLAGAAVPLATAGILVVTVLRREREPESGLPSWVAESSQGAWFAAMVVGFIVAFVAALGGFAALGFLGAALAGLAGVAAGGALAVILAYGITELGFRLR